MKIAAANAIASLARERVPDEVVAAMGGERPTYCKDYIIPSTFDPRLMSVISVAVAKAAIKSGVARKKIKDFDVVDYASRALEETATQTLFGGIQQVGQQKIAKALGYEQPEGAAYYSINIPEFTNLASQDFGVYNSVDLMQTSNGSAFMGANYTNANSLTNTLDSSSNYNYYMNNFSRGINLGLYG